MPTATLLTLVSGYDAMLCMMKAQHELSLAYVVRHVHLYSAEALFQRCNMKMRTSKVRCWRADLWQVPLNLILH